MLFEMATGRRAFAREHTIDTLHAIQHHDPASLPVQTTMPPDLASIVMRLLQKAPADRFQSAADLAWTLASVSRSSVPSHLEPATRGSSISPPRRWRWRGTAAIAAAVAAVGLALSTVEPGGRGALLSHE
jgi:serine/threonine-protein kinase